MNCVCRPAERICSYSTRLKRILCDLSKRVPGDKITLGCYIHNCGGNVLSNEVVDEEDLFAVTKGYLFHIFVHLYELNKKCKAGKYMNRIQVEFVDTENWK